MSHTGYDYEDGELYYGVEQLEEHEGEQLKENLEENNDIKSYRNDQPEEEGDLSFVYDYAEIELAEKLKRVLNLRQINKILMRRKEAVMKKIVNLLNKGLVSDVYLEIGSIYG